MDTSKKYIKMSIGAEEIQELLKDKFDYRRQGYCTQHKRLIQEGPDGGADCPGFLDFYHKSIRRAGKSVYSEKWEKEFGFGSKHDCQQTGYEGRWIGLPYQDQLQEMVGDYEECENCLHLMYTKGRPVWSNDFESFEQLWLAFVMKERYNKTWKDNKWIK